MKHPLLLLPFSLLLLSILWLRHVLVGSEDGINHAHLTRQSRLGPSVVHAGNDSLGFSKIFVIGLSERTDKRDSMSLAASFSGVDFEWLEGVDGERVPEKAIPLAWPKDETAHTLGCWRAHMNAIQRIVKERIPSALILEDDADWDVTLKSQLVEFAHGARFLQQQGSSSEQDTISVLRDSPYGDDWDLLWLGHCGARNREDVDQAYYVTQDDPTAVPQHLWGYRRRQPNLTPPDLQGNFTRIVFEPVRGLCMFGYALSLRGARKLLYHQSSFGGAAVSDRALQHLCNDRSWGFKCLAPYPTLFGTHRPAGPMSKDSDREAKHSKDEYRSTAETGDIVFSTRLNMERLIAGESEALSQWPKDTMLASLDRTFAVPQGKGVWVEASTYQPFERQD